MFNPYFIRALAKNKELRKLMPIEFFPMTRLQLELLKLREQREERKGNE